MDPLRYQAGRTVGYAVLGTAAGALGHTVTGGLQSPTVGWLLSWAMALALAITAARLWRGPRKGLVRLGRARPQGGASLFTRIMRRLPRSPATVGLATGLLPCGALAAAVLLAASTTSPWLGAASMVAFATVSGAGLLGIGLVAQRLRLAARPALQRGLATVLALGAILLALRPLPLVTAHPGPDGGTEAASCPLHAEPE